MAKKKSVLKHDDFVLFAARIFLSVIFLIAAFGKLMNPLGIKAYMTSAGMFAVDFFYICAVLLLVAGGLSVLLGCRTDLGAVLLMLFLIPTTLIFHLDFSDANQIIQLQKNVAILGGLFAIYVAGPGRISVDKK
jgi:putative oxidoreductase